MAINLASKYSSKVVDKFYKDSVILGKTSREYEWDGVKSINVYTITTVAPGDYTRSGTSRYGTPTEVQDTIQTMSIAKDRSVSLTVDKGNNKQQMMIKNAGKVMNAEMREQFIPEFDKYCLKTWAEYKNASSETVQTKIDASVTKDNIVSLIAAGRTALVNKKVPLTNTYCYIGATNFGLLAQAPEFLNLDKLGPGAVENGVVGKCKGFAIVEVPDEYMPTDVSFMIVKKECVLAPTQIKDMKIHQDAPGISGALLEVRWLYDAFVLDTKKDGIYVSRTKALSGD